MLTHLETVGAADRGEVGVWCMDGYGTGASCIYQPELRSTVSIFAVVYLPS